jgi:hypothetical protein
MQTISSNIDLGNGAFREEIRRATINPQLIFIVCTLAIIWALALVIMALVGGPLGSAMIVAASAVVVLIKPNIPTWVYGPVVFQRVFLLPRLPSSKNTDVEQESGHHR